VEPVLELRDATLVRGRNRVLDRLTLTIDRGEHTVILGPNGAGKSSLIRLLTLDDRPRAALDGVPPLRLFGRSNWDVGELRTRLGVVTGELDAGFGQSTSRGRVSGLDVAVSGLLGSHGLFSHHEITESMREQGRLALARVEAAHVACKPLNEMSAGERRRTLIARALVTRPEALVLDEPTTGLDLVARHRFLETIRRLATDGTTVVLVTHHVEEIIPDTRKVVLLVGGRVLHEGTPEDTLTPEWLQAVFGAPVSVTRTGGSYGVKVRG
jgi:iron complex transport system ATP-binding protein